MTMLLCWLVFPLVLALLCSGCGALLEKLGGFRVPGTLLLPVGLATLVVIAAAFTAFDATARLAMPAVVIAAIAGFVIARPWRNRHVNWWAVGAVLGVYLVYAVPVLFSGEPGFAGYIKLDDTATWLALTDRVMDHGPTVGGLAPSSYEATLSSYLKEAGGYPVGAFLPMGIGHKLVRQDLAWLFQPYLAFLAAMLSLGLYTLIERALASRPLRATVAFIAAQPALLFGYGLWGGVKELAAVALMPVLAWLAARAASGKVAWRELLPLAVAVVAVVAVVSVGALVWVTPVLGGAVLVLALRRQWKEIALGAVALIGFGAVLALPLILDGSLNVPTEVLTNQNELGNLAGPLDKLQVLGIWPTGDFRYRPQDFGITKLLLLVAALSALGGALWAAKHKRVAPLLFLAGSALGAFAINYKGSPWADGKALASASPALLLFAMLGGAALFTIRNSLVSRLSGLLVLLVIAFGVLWSNVLAYQSVNVSPYGQLSELQTIGNKYKGQGPTLMTEYQVYGVRHFLREMDAEGASELRRRLVLLRAGGTLPKGGSADIDEFALDAVLEYRTLVLRNTPLASRPPLPYSLVRRGRYFNVWQRPATGGPQVVAHMPLGNDLDPGGIPSCGAVRRLSNQVPDGGYLAAAVATPVTTVWLSRMIRPITWTANAQLPGTVYPATSGTATGQAEVPTDGLYGFWIGGGFRGKLTVTVDGQKVATRTGAINTYEIQQPLGSLYLPRGRHEVVLKYEKGGLYPGSDGAPFPLGPLVISRKPQSHAVHFVPVSKAESLCGRRWDWIEAVGPPA